MQREGRALAGGLLLMAAALPALAVPQPPNPAPQAAPAPPPAAATEATARRIPAAEAREALAKGKAVLVDVRSKQEYDSSHAQGALSIPLTEIDARAGELPKDKLVVTYCT
jgi:3-mercaptopyruvate sulfurtransferase SseA